MQAKIKQRRENDLRYNLYARCIVIICDSSLSPRDNSAPLPRDIYIAAVICGLL